MNVKVKVISASSLEEMIEKMKEQAENELNERRLNCLLGRTFHSILDTEEKIPSTYHELNMMIAEHLSREIAIMKIQEEQYCDYDEAKEQLPKCFKKNCMGNDLN